MSPPSRAAANPEMISATSPTVVRWTLSGSTIPSSGGFAISGSHWSMRSSIWSSDMGAAGSSMRSGSPRAALWQKVATAEL
jgi:hypothetical protein